MTYLGNQPGHPGIRMAEQAFWNWLVLNMRRTCRKSSGDPRGLAWRFNLALATVLSKGENWTRRRRWIQWLFPRPSELWQQSHGVGRSYPGQLGDVHCWPTSPWDGLYQGQHVPGGDPHCLVPTWLWDRGNTLKDCLTVFEQEIQTICPDTLHTE